MNALLSNSSRPCFVSTFLSHSSTDKTLVEAVAKRLGRRGVLAWYDNNELQEMGSLIDVLKQAVQQQITVTLFLSEASLNSEWCKDELRWALALKEGDEHILPVYLGNPLELVKAHDLLKKRFLHPDGDRVDRLGAACQQNPNKPNPDAIAEKIAATAYKLSIPKTWSDLVIFLDQRGTGSRRGEPDLPDNIVRLDAPILTFRPSLEPRQKVELLTGADWEDMVKTITISLSNIPGNIRGDIRKVRVLGGAQTGLMWAIGKHFDRTNNVELYGYGRKGEVITNKDQEVLKPLSGGDPNCAQLVPGKANNLGDTQTEVALYVGIEDYLQDVQQAVPHLTLFWIKTDKIESSEQAMQLVSDTVASIKRLYQDHGVRELVLFWGTANHVALLTAANLTSQHAFPKIKYMERNHARSEYVQLPMPDIF
ncbi:MAG: toll/interleukin-1 receptor domain-containing protein [Leptolyngbyaceae cyanobacterium RM1_406_9]|nr:toll/interleukin-1 receptor domain-containing protein [Leptolyngbyaceae cyanobacterium RM1_406_9]